MANLYAVENRHLPVYDSTLFVWDQHGTGRANLTTLNASNQRLPSLCSTDDGTVNLHRAVWPESDTFDRINGFGVKTGKRTDLFTLYESETDDWSEPTLYRYVEFGHPRPRIIEVDLTR